MLLERIFPFVAAPNANPKMAPEDQIAKNLPKNFKIKALGLGFNTGYTAFAKLNIRQAGFEEPPYDFETIIKAIDTDSYVKQAFSKYKDLFWKEGWDIVGENNEAVEYLYQRIDLMEEAMGRPFNDFLVDVVDQLIKFSNVFIVKARGNLDPYFNLGNGPNTVIGYYIIPTETIRIKRDKFNRPISYKQVLNDVSFNDTANEPTWPAEDVIHLYIDRKPGYAFGTPFIVAALGDILSLRRVEEDILNLIHRELFPLYTFKVGTDLKPASPEELANAAAELDNLRTEGGVILSDRHEVGVVGAESNALNIDEYLKHFKQRVATGLGMYPHHLGMDDGQNRAATDRLDIAMYERVKSLQNYVKNMIRINMFNELLREAGFQPITTPKAPGDSDRCYMKFREIDIDTQIKKQNHIMTLFTSNLIDWKEARMELGLSDDADPNLLLLTMTTNMQTMSQLEITRAAALAAPTPAIPARKPGTVGGSPPKPGKPDAIPSSTGITPNLPNTRKGPGNKNAPSNQFGRRLSPNIRHDEQPIFPINEEILQDVVELLSDSEENEIQLGEYNQDE